VSLKEKYIFGRIKRWGIFLLVVSMVYKVQLKAVSHVQKEVKRCYFKD
jgi:hypothetical protein